MIRNIPNKYTQQMLLDFLNESHRGSFDFLYLRMDFKNRCNVGYAFINLAQPMSVLSLADRLLGKKWQVLSFFYNTIHMYMYIYIYSMLSMLY